MQKYDENENALADLDDKLAQKPEYKKMLNNLLGIGNRDNAIFSSSKTNNLDLSQLLTEGAYSKVFSNKTFSVEINNLKSDEMINHLIYTKDFDSFVQIIDDFGGMLSIADRKLLESDFDIHKEKIITKLKKKKNQKISRWKRFRNKYLDKQAQLNSWPLYVGAMFIKVKTTSSTIYAPLIMKKVEIKITNTNKVKINAIDDGVDINEKVLFLLQNEYKFNLPKLIDSEKYSIDDVIEIYTESLKDIIQPEFNFRGKFEYSTKREVTNQNVEYAKGAVLTITSPSGGALRDKLIEMLESDELDDLLDVDALQDFKAEINDDLEKGKAVYRINQTDFSQEKAIIGSLKDHAVIWGPPGTGKSQTISNVIANILANEQSAIITSEKKAALDVIQKRMGKLSKFMYFGLTDKNVDKKQFYKPFNDLMEIVSKRKSYTNFSPSTLISSKKMNMFKQSEKLKDMDLNNLSLVHKKIKLMTKEQTMLIFQYEDLLKENENIIKKVKEDKTIDTVVVEMGIEKKGFLFKRYPKNIRKIVKITNILNNDSDFILKFNKVEDKSVLKNMELYINTEKESLIDRSKFSSDEDYLEQLLADRFAHRLYLLRQDEITGKKVKSFIKNCISGFRIPYKFVALYKDVIEELFDVFVSTPQTLAASIDMNRRYDYSIFDEASQLHLEKAMPFISLGNISVIAGDSQQMRPTSYFGVRDKTELLEDAEANVDSLLDFAYRKGMKSREYMLTKNYRSKSAELMMFSSKEFYEGNLDVIDNKELCGVESIEVFNVNGKWEGRVNEKEAKLMLDKLLETQDQYKKIILLTLNSTQKQYVESMIYAEERYADIIQLLGEGRVFLRNLENIQGDEADLVIVSVAYDKDAHLGATYVAKPEGKNALNVAISRAIEKMIVFKSISSDEVKGNSKNDSMRVFREWLAYLESTSKERQAYGLDGNRKSERFDSTFEEDVYDELRKSIRVPKDTFIQTQFPVGSYSVDMVIIDSFHHHFIMGIEVDGYKYHSGFEKMTKDIERQSFIEAKGYSPIFRITELNWRVNKDLVIKDVQTLIDSIK